VRGVFDVVVGGVAKERCQNHCRKEERGHGHEGIEGGEYLGTGLPGQSRWPRTGTFEENTKPGEKKKERQESTRHWHLR